MVETSDDRPAPVRCGVSAHPSTAAASQAGLARSSLLQHLVRGFVGKGMTIE
jgi:hypothetical protein